MDHLFNHLTTGLRHVATRLFTTDSNDKKILLIINQPLPEIWFNTPKNKHRAGVGQLTVVCQAHGSD